MLKNILYACALSSIVTFSAFAQEAEIDAVNPTAKAVVIENEEIQEPKLASSCPEEDKSNLFASNEKEILVTEEIPASETSGCGCKGKGKDKGANLLACCGEEEEASSAVEEQQQNPTIACGKCGGKHHFLAVEDQQDESETTILKSFEEEVKAA